MSGTKTAATTSVVRIPRWRLVRRRPTQARGGDAGASEDRSRRRQRIELSDLPNRGGLPRAGDRSRLQARLGRGREAHDTARRGSGLRPAVPGTRELPRSADTEALALWLRASGGPLSPRARARRRTILRVAPALRQSVRRQSDVPRGGGSRLVFGIAVQSPDLARQTRAATATVHPGGVQGRLALWVAGARARTAPSSTSRRRAGSCSNVESARNTVSIPASR